MTLTIERPEVDDSPYCEHGKYVGGCGADYMCQWCEDGTPWEEYVAIQAVRANRRARWRLYDRYTRKALQQCPFDHRMPEFVGKMFGAIAASLYAASGQ